MHDLRNGCLTLLMLLALLIAGCSGSECYENHSALPLATFYNAGNRAEVSLQGVEIYGIGAPRDSILYPRQTLKEAYLPFRMWEDSTTYVIEYQGMVSDSIVKDHPELIPRDTVTFRYKPKPWFVSPACGAMYFYEMRGVDFTRTLIDSVAYNDLITNENAANIKMYFKEIGQ